MKIQNRLVLLVLISLFISSGLSCRRQPPALDAIDQIDRRSNLPLGDPISRDLAEIRQRGALVVLAPYNSTTYFIYQGEPLGYEFELLRAFAKDLGVPLKMIVVAEPTSIFPLLNSGDGDIAASRLIPPKTPDVQSHVAFTHALYRTEPALVQQGQAPSAAGEGAEKALAPGPPQPLPEVDIQARLVTNPAQLAGRTVTLAQESGYRRTLIELSDEISGDIHIVEIG